MTSSETPGLLKRFGRISWKFQKTFSIPMKRRSHFVAAIIAAHESIRGGCVAIDQVVFEPKHLMALLAKYSLPVFSDRDRDWSLEANGREEVAELLEAVLSDWIDFICVPEPKSFMIYTDHDGYTTFFANTKSNLNRVINTLPALGFICVENYVRKL